jgi:hypothetical protein
MIIRYAANCSVPYDRKLRSQTFIVQATGLTHCLDLPEKNSSIRLTSARQPDQRRELPVSTDAGLEALRSLLGRQLHPDKGLPQRHPQVSGLERGHG